MNFLRMSTCVRVCHGARYNRETLEVHFKGKTSRTCSTCRSRGCGLLRRGPASRATSGRWWTSVSAMSGSASRPHPLRREASGSSSPPSCRSDRPAGRSTSWTSRRQVCTSRTSTSCSGAAGPVDKATPSSSSSTTSTSSRARLDRGHGSEAVTRCRVIAQGTPEQVALVEDSYTGQFLAPVLATAPGRRAAEWLDCRAVDDPPLAATKTRSQGPSHKVPVTKSPVKKAALKTPVARRLHQDGAAQDGRAQDGRAKSAVPRSRTQGDSGQEGRTQKVKK